MPPIASQRPSLADAVRDRIVLSDGSVGTRIYAKGVFINTCYESLNLTRGHFVKNIHLEYAKAGAEILGTNTFGAHRWKLAKHGLADKVREINLAGVKLAREAAQNEAWVVGVVGPPGTESEGARVSGARELREVYAEQVRYLVEGGVDGLFIQSFSSLEALGHVVEAARGEAGDLPLAALVLLGADGKTSFGDGAEAVGEALDRMPADFVGLNDGPGAQALVRALGVIRAKTSKPLVLEPGTGMPVRHEDLTLNLSTPEYFMELLRQGIKAGARIIGGSCGADPEHIRAIHASVRMLQPGAGTQGNHASISVDDGREGRLPTVNAAATPSRFAAKLRAGQFVVSVEIDPPVGTDATASLERAGECAAAGVDCINIADGPRATARMGPVDMAMLMRAQVPGIEPIVHFCCRDRNILGMQADLIGANALGIHNVLMITGDPPKLGDYPFATAVYDVDAIGALRIGRRLNEGEDLAGNPLKGNPTGLHLGAGANPGAIDLDVEIERLKMKVDAGAEYILTQPVYEQDLFERFHDHVAAIGVPILIGILPLASYRNAEFLHNEVPGMQVPLAIRNRMKACKDKDAAREMGIEIACEALAHAAPRVQGVYVMPPFNRVESALQVLAVVRDRMDSSGASAAGHA